MNIHKLINDIRKVIEEQLFKERNKDAEDAEFKEEGTK